MTIIVIELNFNPNRIDSGNAIVRSPAARAVSDQ